MCADPVLSVCVKYEAWVEFIPPSYVPWSSYCKKMAPHWGARDKEYREKLVDLEVQMAVDLSCSMLEGS